MNDKTSFGVNLGANIRADCTDSILTLVIDLSKTQGASKSGKSDTIATTNGNKPLPDGATIGLNVYRKR